MGGESHTLTQTCLVELKISINTVLITLIANIKIVHNMHFTSENCMKLLDCVSRSFLALSEMSMTQLCMCYINT